VLSNKPDNGWSVNANDRVECVMAQNTVQGIRFEGNGAHMSEGSKIEGTNSP
jgi:hypothetical protein